MKDHIVETYENYREEDRLTTNNSRRIEYLTTVDILDGLIKPGSAILDCAAGTGVYAFHFAERGHRVTATDITPRHIEYIKKAMEGKPYKMEAAVLDAVDMSMFEDESFDAVLNMGTFYHLIDEGERQRCLSECLRVLKKGGLLVTAYIPRYFVFQYVALRDKSYLDEGLAKRLVETGRLRHDDEKCFWTDTYYSSCEEMEGLYRDSGLEIIDHFAQDGITPMFAEKVDNWSDEEFEVWHRHHLTVCRERSMLGASNHVIIVGKKI